MSATRSDFSGAEGAPARFVHNRIETPSARMTRTVRMGPNIAVLWMASMLVFGCGARVQPGGGSGDAGVDAQSSWLFDARVRDGRSSAATSSPSDGAANSTQSSTSTSSEGAADGATCLAGQIVCGGSCVTPSNDPSNCGGCRKTCSGSSPYCASGHCEGTPPSCAPGGPGMTDCGDAGNESCCTSLGVVGGTYYREYGGANFVDGGFQFYDGGVSDPAKVSSYRLDKYLVTVGRYRQFVAAWNEGWVPAAGSGKHTYLNGGQGLVDSSSGGYEPGWVADDDQTVMLGQQGGCGAASTWTNAVGNQEKLPINCVSWYTAYAFCIWDGGFLPAEAEWEYAAAGGAEQRDWVWGTAAPGTSNEYSIYQCYYDGQGAETCTGVANVAPVGTATLGVARWGQLDMAGEMEEWVLDLGASYQTPCVDCVYLGITAYYEPVRVIRGASFEDDIGWLSPTSRTWTDPQQEENRIGMRCARAPSE